MLSHSYSGTESWLAGSSSHGHYTEDYGYTFEDNIDEGEKEGETANVVESFPGIGVLHWLSRPDGPHSENPENIHDNGAHSQSNDLNSYKTIGQHSDLNTKNKVNLLFCKSCSIILLIPSRLHS